MANDDISAELEAFSKFSTWSNDASTNWTDAVAAAVGTMAGAPAGLAPPGHFPAMDRLRKAIGGGDDIVADNAADRPQEWKKAGEHWANQLGVMGLDALAARQTYWNTDAEAANRTTTTEMTNSLTPITNGNMTTRSDNARTAEDNRKVVADNEKVLSQHDDAADQPMISAAMERNEQIEQNNAEAVEENREIERENAAHQRFNDGLPKA
jgi:hypothetical protein